MNPEVSVPNVPLETPGSGASEASAAAESSRWVVTRRQVLGGSVALSAATMLVRYDPALHSLTGVEDALLGDTPESLVIVTPARPALHFSIARPEDLLLLDITFYGFSVVKGPRFPSLVATAAKTNANWIGVVVQFPPQAIGEGNYDKPQKVTQPLSFDPTPVLSQVSGPSRLAFTFNHGDKIPLPTSTAADILNWSGWRLNVTRAALTGTNAANAVAPQSFETAIECPLAMILSPVVDGNGSILLGNFTTQFENRTKPFTGENNVTECWTTTLESTYSRIGLGGVISESIKPAMSGVWATDYLGSVNATDETQIVYYPYEVIK